MQDLAYATASRTRKIREKSCRPERISEVKQNID